MADKVVMGDQQDGLRGLTRYSDNEGDIIWPAWRAELKQRVAFRHEDQDGNLLNDPAAARKARQGGGRGGGRGRGRGNGRGRGRVIHQRRAKAQGVRCARLCRVTPEMLVCA